VENAAGTGVSHDPRVPQTALQREALPSFPPPPYFPQTRVLYVEMRMINGFRLKIMKNFGPMRRRGPWPSCPSPPSLPALGRSATRAGNPATCKPENFSFFFSFLRPSPMRPLTKKLTRTGHGGGHLRLFSFPSPRRHLRAGGRAARGMTGRRTFPGDRSAWSFPPLPPFFFPFFVREIFIRLSGGDSLTASPTKGADPSGTRSFPSPFSFFPPLFFVEPLRSHVGVRLPTPCKVGQGFSSFSSFCDAEVHKDKAKQSSRLTPSFFFPSAAPREMQYERGALEHDGHGRAGVIGPSSFPSFFSFPFLFFLLPYDMP